jgi:D-beta-D-heptose 7-phosphate kinase/D-beta-D-heptose 1-phosphate adenosyltransferase
MPGSLEDIIGAFDGKRVLGLGDLMLDEYILGDVRRISPEAPVPVVEVLNHTHVPGGAGNVAANVVSLGGVALLGGVVGKDHQADRLREALVRKGVALDGLFTALDRQTTTKTRIIAHQQQIVRVDAEQRAPLSMSVENELLDWAEQQMTQVDACILSDYAKGVVSQRVATHFISLARRARKPVVVDPKGTNYVNYRGATVVKPNVHEAERAVKLEITCAATLEAAGRQLLDRLEGGSLLITRGPQGMSLFQYGTEPVHIPSVAREIYDVTGAGDTVVSTLALALASGATLEQAAHLANAAAGIAVGKMGTTAVTLAELRDALI